MFDDRQFAHEVKLTPKENYFRMLDGKEVEWLPAYFNSGNALWNEELLTPVMAPDGPVTTTLNVTYVGNPDLNYGAMPQPNVVQIDDICKWRDQLKITDLSDFDFADYYKKKMDAIDRENNFVSVGGADYFLTLVSLMGFENTLVAMYEEPEEVHALLDRIHEFYMFIFDKQLRYCQPEMLATMDDICTQKQPFFSLDDYHEFFMPLEKQHYDIARDRGMHIGHHCCGLAEIFVPDWVEMGVQTWNPAQHMNDLVGIKRTYGDKLAIEGGWDNVYFETCDDEEEIREATRNYIDTYAPGGHFGFFAVCGGDIFHDEKAQWRDSIVKDVYFSYGFDYYQNH